MDTHFLYDVFQFLTVFLLVAGCTLYCLLMLAPNALKRPLKQALLRCPLPTWVAARLQQTTAKGACGANCSACSSSAAITKPVQWHPRQR